MTLLLIGIVIFAGIHLLAMLLPGARDGLRERLGEGPFKGLFSLVSLIGLGLMIYGFYTTRGTLEPGDYLYTPAPWTRHAAMGLRSSASACGHALIFSPMAIGPGSSCLPRSSLSPCSTSFFRRCAARFPIMSRSSNRM